MSKNLNFYDFLINDEDEVMLLLYTREGSPLTPSISIDTTTNSATFYRNETDSFSLQEVPADIIDALQDVDNILVCELSDDEENPQIVNAYEAEIID